MHESILHIQYNLTITGTDIICWWVLPFLLALLFLINDQRGGIYGDDIRTLTYDDWIVITLIAVFYPLAIWAFIYKVIIPWFRERFGKDHLAEMHK